MAWNPSPKVADFRDIARKWKKQQVIILAIDLNANTLEYASFGETRKLCDDAKRLADVAYAEIVHRMKLDTVFSADVPESHEGRRCGDF